RTWDSARGTSSCPPAQEGRGTHCIRELLAEDLLRTLLAIFRNPPGPRGAHDARESCACTRPRRRWDVLRRIAGWNQPFRVQCRVPRAAVPAVRVSENE